MRELRYVMERAAMAAQDGRLDLDRSLPRKPEPIPEPPPEPEVDEAPPRVLTVDEIQQLEYDNIVRALEASGGEVGGENGAARLLGVKPATVTARMKALGIGAAPAKPRRPTTRRTR